MNFVKIQIKGKWSSEPIIGDRTRYATEFRNKPLLIRRRLIDGGGGCI